MQMYRLDLAVWPERVAELVGQLQAAMEINTDWDNAQVTFYNLRSEKTVPTIDVQVE